MDSFIKTLKKLSPDQKDLLDNAYYTEGFNDAIHIAIELHERNGNNLYECSNWKIYTPKDDDCIVVFEDPFGHKRTIDIAQFEQLMTILHSVQDY